MLSLRSRTPQLTHHSVLQLQRKRRSPGGSEGSPQTSISGRSSSVPLLVPTPIQTYEGTKRMETDEKVPRWILLFTASSLSLDPLPPTSVVADCPKITATDLSCGVSNIETLDERCVRVGWYVARLSYQYQDTGRVSLKPRNSEARNNGPNCL